MSATMNGPTPIANSLVLAERLVALAIDADRSGFAAAARRLIATAHSVLDRPGAGQAELRSRQRAWHSRTEAPGASLEPVGVPAQTATIHTLRFGADGQRGGRGPHTPDCERLAISRLTAAN
jgi:hypothetical protein